MSALPASRVNYFDRQYLRLSELNDEQAYHLQLHRRHNLSHHSWGIVLGLELVSQEDRAVVMPGLAVDGYGRELLLLERKSYNRDEFDRLATNRIDLWLEYRLFFTTDPMAPIDCGASDPRKHYRAIERAEVFSMRAGARPDPRRPPGVPPEVFDEPLLATPDDPALRWPIYLGRIIMQIPDSGLPTFTIEAADRVYAGLNAELIDHPGNASRIELGRRPQQTDEKTIGNDTFSYAAVPDRDFAVFVPDHATTDPQGAPPLEPTLSIYGKATQILGSAEVHGNVVLDGSALQFTSSDENAIDPASIGGHPSIYRAGDELRIDVGELNNADRSFVLGVSKDGKFQPAVTIRFPGNMTSGGAVNPVVTVHGDLHIDGTIQSPDIRTRTLTEDVAAQITGMLQAAILSGGA